MNTTEVVANKVQLKDNDAFIRKIAQRAGEYSAHPAVLTVADDLYKNGARGLFNFTRDKILYAKDSSFGENLRMPDYIIDKIFTGKTPVGDCDDKTLFLATLLLNKGYPVRIIGAHYLKGEGGPNDINHVYLEYKDYKSNPDKWIPLDPTGMPFGQKSPQVIPLVYYKVNVPSRLTVSAFTEADLRDASLHRISQYHSQLFSRMGLFDAKDLEILRFFNQYDNDDLVSQFIDQATPIINRYGVLRVQDLKKFNPEVVHRALWVKATAEGNLIKPYDKVASDVKVEVIPLFLVVGVAAAVVTGVFVYMSTKDAKKAIVMGLVAGVIMGAATWAVTSIPSLASAVSLSGGGGSMSIKDLTNKSRNDRIDETEAKKAGLATGINAKYDRLVRGCGDPNTHQTCISNVNADRQRDLAALEQTTNQMTKPEDNSYQTARNIGQASGYDLSNKSFKESWGKTFAAFMSRFSGATSVQAQDGSGNPLPNDGDNGGLPTPSLHIPVGPILLGAGGLIIGGGMLKWLLKK